MSNKLTCCHGPCQKTIEKGQKYYLTNYGEYCSDECYNEVIKSVLGTSIEVAGEKITKG